MMLKCLDGPMDGAVYPLSHATQVTTRKPDGLWFDAQDEHLVQEQYQFDRLAEGGDHVTMIYRYTGKVVDTGLTMETDKRPETGKLFNCNNLDSVRIEVLGETRALTIPLSLVLDSDHSLCQVREHGHALIVYKVEDDGWFAECGGYFFGRGETPLQAIANMKE